MPIGIVGATLISAGVGAAASIYAANTQATAASKALGLQQSMYDQSRADLSPYRQEGTYALNSINALYGYPQVGYGTPTAAPTGGNGSGNPLAGGVGGFIQNLLHPGQNGTGAPSSGAPATAPAAGTGTPDYSGFFNSPDYQFALQQGGLAVDRSAAAHGLLMSGGTLKDLTAFGQGLASQQYGNYFNRLMSLATMGQNSASQSATNANQFGQTGGNTINQIGAAQASGPVGVANALSTLPQNLLYAQMFANGGSPSSYSTPANSGGIYYGTGSIHG